MITIEIAGLVIGLDNRYSYMEMIAQDYLSDKEPMFVVCASDEDIANERANGIVGFDDAYVEAIALYRKISEILPSYDAFLFHGVAIELNGGAYIITADSGVGKTTHTRLWLSEFSDVDIINGDKPIIRIIDGVVYAFGTPWNGKERYGKNSMAQVKGFVFLERAEKNRAYPILPEDAVIRFMSQIYKSRTSKLGLTKTLILANKVIKSARLVHLECNMDPESAHVCRRALTENDTQNE